MIEAVTNKSLAEIMPLVEQYLHFYKVDFSDLSTYSNFFLQFAQEDSLDKQFLYRAEGQAVGFATVYFSFVTSQPGRIAVLNDLYTLPEFRGRGFGRRLIEHCRNYARAKGAVRLQWLTQPENRAAQGLYDSTPAKSSSWIVYTYPTT